MTLDPVVRTAAGGLELVQNQDDIVEVSDNYTDEECEAALEAAACQQKLDNLQAQCLQELHQQEQDQLHDHNLERSESLRRGHGQWFPSQKSQSQKERVPAWVFCLDLDSTVPSTYAV